MDRHAGTTQNNNFAISLQYFKKEVSDEVDFFHADKYESLLQIDAMILMGMVKHSSRSQNSKFAMSLQYLTKGVTDEVHVDKHQSFIHVDFNTLGIKVSCKVILSLLLGMIKHSQSTQSNKFAISLYLYIFIFELIFCMQISINVSTSWDYCFGWKWSDMSKIPKIGSW